MESITSSFVVTILNQKNKQENSRYGSNVWAIHCLVRIFVLVNNIITELFINSCIHQAPLYESA